MSKKIRMKGLLLTLALSFAVLFGMTLCTLQYTYDDQQVMKISPETAWDICYQLTNNSISIASADNGKLVCNIPQYNKTENIIILRNKR